MTSSTGSATILPQLSRGEHGKSDMEEALIFKYLFGKIKLK